MIITAIPLFIQALTWFIGTFGVGVGDRIAGSLGGYLSLLSGTLVLNHHGVISISGQNGLLLGVVVALGILASTSPLYFPHEGLKLGRSITKYFRHIGISLGIVMAVLLHFTI
jgi:hypothetical protein